MEDERPLSITMVEGTRTEREREREKD